MGINQAAFIKAVREYRDRTGNTLEDVAGALGISVHSLRSYVYAVGRLPSLNVATRAAELFGCSITKLIDDPNPPKR